MLINGRSSFHSLNHQYAAVVERVISTFREFAKELAYACGQHSRPTIDIAKRPDCRRILQRSMYLLQRFELSSSFPHHESAACQMYLCIDHDTEEKNTVALKVYGSTRPVVTRDYSSLQGVASKVLMISIHPGSV